MPDLKPFDAPEWQVVIIVDSALLVYAILLRPILKRMQKQMRVASQEFAMSFVRTFGALGGPGLQFRRALSISLFLYAGVWFHALMLLAEPATTLVVLSIPLALIVGRIMIRLATDLRAKWDANPWWRRLFTRRSARQRIDTVGV